MIAIDVTRRQGDFTLALSLTAPGGVTSVFGRSGAGKTSLLRCIAGLDRPDTGRIAVGETVFFDAAEKIDLPVRARRIGYVFQDARLFPHMTVRQNLHYGGDHEADRVIDLLGLEPLLARRPAGLSGGEAQRVAIGRALLSDPRLLLLDEPLSGLDAPRKAEVMPWLEKLRDGAGLPIVHVSHDISEVARLARTLVLIDGGRLVRAGPVEDLLSDPALVPQLGVRDAGALIHAEVLSVDRADGLTALRCGGGVLHLPGDLGPIGRRLRLRVPAQDVILSRDRPDGLSALNILAVTITGLSEGQGPGVAVGLRAGQDRLLARITRRSATRMRLATGGRLHAILKATAVAPGDVGGDG